ncbi:MAG: gliding motility-associated C-terminal domain-containing protein [Bacteroidota bacterium]
MKRFILFTVFSFLMLHFRAQTIIMNEVSNGPTGNQEYVEFVVVSNTVTYNCNNTTPPCIDIRGWIFDDNSGLHGGTSGTGVAAGAIRFSQNAIWQCIPLGTIILIYNNLDRNPAIPPDDLSMADGNCKIIAPVNSPNLFETNTTTPGAVACSYPPSGWTAVGTWSTTLLANSGDCARIVNLAGCEVFSVCYGTANTNNLIYFSGTGGQSVYYFNDVDPSQQNNWSIGSASSSPGDQTPGSPNNAANAAFISKFNNGCMPITPLTIGTPTAVASSGCGCNGSASVSSSGSIGPYTYQWFDSTPLAIGQTSSTASGLCPGVYKAVITSYIGCKDSVFVTINSSSGPSVTVNSATICSGASAILTATPSSSGGTYSWTPGGQTTQTISVNPVSDATYAVTYSISGCVVTNSTVVYVNPSPTLTITSTSPSLCASGQSATLSLSGSIGTCSWSNGNNGSSISVNTPGVYSATVITASCGNTQSTFTIGSLPAPSVTISPFSVSLCPGQSATVQANTNTAVTYSWSTGATTSTVALNSAGNYTVDVFNSCGSASSNVSVSVSSVPSLSISSSAVTICQSGQTATLTAVGSTGTYAWSNGSTASTTSISSPGNYSVTVNVPGCGNTSANISLGTAPLPNVFIFPPPTSSVCAGGSILLKANSNENNYQWPGGVTTDTFSATSSPVVVTSTNACGSLPATIALNFVSPPTVTISPNTLTLCSGQSATLEANADNATTYAWSNGATTYTTVVNSSGVETVTVSNVCGSTPGSITISSASLPVINLTSSAYTICPNETATLTVTGASEPYAWSNSLSTGSIVTTNGGIVSVSNTNICGTVTETINIDVLNLNASIIANPQSGTAPLIVNFTNNSSGGNNYLWDFGNGNSANTQTASIQSYSVAGTYTVYLTVTNGSCSDTDFLIINVLKEEPYLVVPNVFTPNNDSVNDIFKITGFNIVDFNCIVFDRWGLQLFSWNDIKKGWDGKVNGKEATDGTYFYIINAKDIDNKEIKKQGTVTLFK